MATAAEYQDWQSQRAANGEDPNDAQAWRDHNARLGRDPNVSGANARAGGPQPIAGSGYWSGMISDAQFADRLALDRDRYSNVELPTSQAQNDYTRASIGWGNRTADRGDQALSGYLPGKSGQDVWSALLAAGDAYSKTHGGKGMPSQLYSSALQAAGIPRAQADAFQASIQSFIQTNGRFPTEQEGAGLAASGGVGQVATLDRDVLNEKQRQFNEGLAFDKAKYETQLATNPRDFMGSLYYGSSDRGGGSAGPTDPFRAAQAPGSQPQTYQERIAQVQASPVYLGLTEPNGTLPAYGAPQRPQRSLMPIGGAQPGNPGAGGDMIGPMPGENFTPNPAMVGYERRLRAGGQTPAPASGYTPAPGTNMDAFRAAQQPGQMQALGFGGNVDTATGQPRAANRPIIGAGRSIDVTRWRNLAPTQRDQFRSMASASGYDPGDWEEEMRRAAPQSGGASYTTGYRSRF